MVITAQQSAPVVPRNTTADGYTNYVRPSLPAKSLATSMPSDRQTSIGILQAGANKAAGGEYQEWKRSRIFNPKQTSIAITAENFLKAKAGIEPLYMHNIAATKLALMSVISRKPIFLHWAIVFLTLFGPGDIFSANSSSIAIIVS